MKHRSLSYKVIGNQGQGFEFEIWQEGKPGKIRSPKRYKLPVQANNEAKALIEFGLDQVGGLVELVLDHA